MAYNVKWYQSGMAGGPTLASATAGSLNALLRACLIDGFNSLSVTSATYSSGTGKVTLTFGAAHGFLKHQIIAVSGATEANYNGEQRVTSVPTTTTLEYVPAAAPASTTTGTILCKTPAVGGWVETYYDGGTHKLILSRSSGAATPYKIVITNNANYSSTESYTTYICKVEIVQGYVNDTTYEVVHTTYPAAGWRTSAGEDWSLQGDHLGFYWSNQYAVNSRSSTYWFGDIVSLRPGDAGHFAVCGTPNGDVRWNATGNATHRGMVGIAYNVQNHLMTGYDQLQGTATFDLMMTGSTAVGDEIANPSLGTTGMFFFNGPWLIREVPATPCPIRGYMPGMIAPLQNDQSWHRRILEGVPWVGGALIYVNKSQYNNVNDSAAYLFAVRLDEWRTIVG